MNTGPWNLLMICTVIVRVTSTALGEINSHIVGGVEANVEEFPWQGSLQIRSGENWVHICGCVLYSPGKAVTAAHCLGSSATSYRVGFGIHRLSNVENGEGATSGLTSYTTHPNYDANGSGYPNDVAVLRLTTAMDTSSSAIGTITLASDGSDDFSGQNCVISGWGRLEGNGGALPDALQKVNMTVISNFDCLIKWLGVTVNSGHVCIEASGKSACNGDSGGPLVCGSTLVGVTSWGLSSCDGSRPSVYTRISNFYSWIQSQ